MPTDEELPVEPTTLEVKIPVVCKKCGIPIDVEGGQPPVYRNVTGQSTYPIVSVKTRMTYLLEDCKIDKVSGKIGSIDKTDPNAIPGLDGPYHVACYAKIVWKDDGTRVEGVVD